MPDQMTTREELEMRSHVGMCLLLGVGGILLATVVGAVPFGGALPLLLVGGCLLLHLFAPHGGHTDQTPGTTAAARRGEPR
jgi:hypothetical protein